MNIFIKILLIFIAMTLVSIDNKLGRIGKILEQLNKERQEAMSYRVRRGSLADDTTILKIRWCRLHRSEYWDKCWTAWAGRAFMPIHCEGCEFFDQRFADTKRNELFCR